MSARQARIARKQRQRDGLDAYVDDGPTMRSHTTPSGYSRAERRHPDQHDVRSKA